jgi:small subunit ribosomal protein S20
VPNTKSARKRLRQSERRRVHNKAARSRLKTALKRVRATSDPQQAATSFREAARLLDRAASKGLIHKNRADRSKGRLAAHVKRVGGTP